MCEHPDALTTESWRLKDPVPVWQLSDISVEDVHKDTIHTDHRAAIAAAKSAMYVQYVGLVFNVLGDHLAALPGQQLEWVGRAAAELDGSFKKVTVSSTVGLLIAELATRQRFDAGLGRLLRYRDQTLLSANEF